MKEETVTSNMSRGAQVNFEIEGKMPERGLEFFWNVILENVKVIQQATKLKIILKRLHCSGF